MAWKGWAATLLPTCVVLLYFLFDRWMPGPTAGALAFLAVILVAYFFFPKIKLTFVRVAVGLLLALVVLYAIALFSYRS